VAPAPILAVLGAFRRSRPIDTRRYTPSCRGSRAPTSRSHFRAGSGTDYLGSRTLVSRAGLPSAALCSCRFGLRLGSPEHLLSGYTNCVITRASDNRTRARCRCVRVHANARLCRSQGARGTISANSARIRSRIRLRRRLGSLPVVGIGPLHIRRQGSANGMVKRCSVISRWRRR
jgi:hypothetical protein